MSLRWRKNALTDYHNVVRWYRDTGPEDLSGDQVERFIDAVITAEQSIEQFPALGSHRLSEVATLLPLRYRRVSGFPYLLFYLSINGDPEIVRLLHISRNLPAHLRGAADLEAEPEKYD